MKILVYCAAGARAALAAKTLMYIGYKDVFNLGGFKEWVENGGEIEVIQFTFFKYSFNRNETFLRIDPQNRLQSTT